MGLAQLARLDQTGIDMLLDRQHRINEALNPVDAVGHRVSGDPVGCGRHALDHITVGHGEAHIVFEEIAMGKHVGDDQLILNQRIAVQQKGIAGIGVDDQLVDFA
ncbi:hypothetical protein D3C73_1064180 [compost metagenome]